MRGMRWLSVAVLGGGLVVGGAGAAGAAGAPYCGITWGSLAKSGGSLSPGPLLAARTGRHACYDRVVFDFAGPATGYRVRYATAVPQEGSGAALPVAGGAQIWVELLEPSYDQTGRSTTPYRAGQHVGAVAGYRTLRDVVYGSSFEGYTAFGVGVRARLPYRVFTLPGPGGRSRIVLDVAHHW